MNLDNTINEIRRIFNTYNLNGSLLQVGSSTKSDKFHDIDLLFVTNKSVTDIEKAFLDYDLILLDDAIRILGICECEVSIAVYSYSNVEEIVYNFLTGKKVLCEHRSWAIGYWICEGFINDLVDANILFDDKNRISDIVDKLKTRKYGEERILKDCLDEISIKEELLISRENKLYEMAKNDIVLALIRSSYILAGKRLKSFKNLEEVILSLPLNYQEAINMFMKTSDIKNVEFILEKMKEKINYLNNIYLGTWQFSGDFKKLSEEEIKVLIEYAKEKGISNFDTALVYGNGSVEKYLSKYTTDTDKITTKIPAKKKPTGDINSLEEYYEYDYMKSCVLKSLENLKRDQVETILLHNWHKSFNDSMELLTWLVSFKNEKLTKKIGISLPNNYNETLPDNVLKMIDVIEVPYNIENEWILKDIDTYKKYGIEIILRSLFIQGKNCEQLEKKLNSVKYLNTSVVIGMTSTKQIDDNIKVLIK